ncbi:hypothetical protein CDEST_07215 [Colletotrichum destructivum]|uniref:Uncharacterized protein n=1 Tax=Colletotrichum destructivum TaxID=34406 RepID=A0AAX4IGG6_9PEZI|nr:hypothetical protein CDEST_07215 [Colletotrichum destructivum]
MTNPSFAIHLNQDQSGYISILGTGFLLNFHGVLLNASPSTLHHLTAMKCLQVFCKVLVFSPSQVLGSRT